MPRFPVERFLVVEPRPGQGKVEHHELAKELLAGFVTAELDKHFEQGSFGHLDRWQAMRMAQEQAQGLLNHRRR